MEHPMSDEEDVLREDCSLTASPQMLHNTSSCTSWSYIHSYVSGPHPHVCSLLSWPRPDAATSIRARRGATRSCGTRRCHHHVAVTGRVPRLRPTAQRVRKLVSAPSSSNSVLQRKFVQGPSATAGVHIELQNMNGDRSAGHDLVGGPFAVIESDPGEHSS